MNFTVCSYNMGTNRTDYTNHLHYHQRKKNPGQMVADIPTTLTDDYDNAQGQTAARLKGRAQVYCLQEVIDNERPLIKSLGTEGFTIIHCEEDNWDAAIAIDGNRFEEIENHSCKIAVNDHFSKDVAIATAVNKKTKAKVLFVSAHVPGYDLSKDKIEEESRDGIRRAEGDIYCQGIAQQIEALHQDGNISWDVVAGDFNTNPERWGGRFQIFSDKGFTLHRTNRATNVNPNETYELLDREIDFIFTKKNEPPKKINFIAKIKSLFFKNIKHSTKIHKKDPIGFNTKKNASDHAPVFVKISSSSLIRRFFGY